MMPLRLATSVLLLAAGIGSPSTIRAAAALDPAGEQLALIRIAGCSFDGARVNDPICEYFIIEDTDRTHVISIPGGDSPAWSPDGTHLLVVAQGDIFVNAVTGDTSVNLTNHPAYDSSPAWSPDGARIAFSSDRDGPPGLYVMNADGSNVVRIATDASQPTWSPDGTRLAFSCGGICMINADGSGFSRLTTEVDYSPKWSPDGAKILFVTERYGGFISTDWGDLPGSQLAVMNTDGSNVIQLNTGAYAYDPAWSPDGSRIAFVAVYENPGFSWLWNIVWIMNADGTGLTELESGRSPAWRPRPGGVNDRPVASFTVQCVDLTCAFDASSSSDSDGTIRRYGWQFSDGLGSGATVSHTFPGGHDYYVQLVVMDDGGALGATTQFVPLNKPPVPSFTVTCTGLRCTFNASASFDPDGTIAGFIWRFGDGGDGIGFPAIAHTYAAAGTYTVTLTATDNAGSRVTQSQNVMVNGNAPPVASFTSACTGLTCTFDGAGSSDPDGTIASYAWSFGDATTGSGVMASHTYAAAGTYTVGLVVTDNLGATSFKSSSVTVNAPPVALFTATCSALTCTFDGSGSSDPDGMITSYAWSFGDTTTGSGVTASHTYAASGTYAVSLTVRDNAGVTGVRAGSVTVSGPTMHIGDLDGMRTNQQNAWTALVTITLHDSNHAPLANATVSGSWSIGGTASCATDGSGKCFVSKSAIPKSTKGVTFTIVNATNSTFLYRSVDNHDPDGDSNGTSVTVSNP